MATPSASESIRAREGDDQIWSLELEMFEGPLDLLLHLVRTHELDILDIPIAFVCEKYLEYLAFMRALDLEIAGDYLVMAATLAYLKSRELLPTEPDAGEAEVEELGPDPREALIAQLLLHQTYSAAGEQLDRLPVSGRDVFGRGQDIDLPPLDSGLAPVTLFRLAEAFHRVLQRARINRSHEVIVEGISVTERMRQLALLLENDQRFDFERLFLERPWSSERELRSLLVVTLVSILELVKLGAASVHQPTGSTAIIVERTADRSALDRAIASYEGQQDPEVSVEQSQGVGLADTDRSASLDSAPDEVSSPGEAGVPGDPSSSDDHG